MCFSVTVPQNRAQLAKRFQARVNDQAFAQLEKNAREFPKKFKTPDPDGRIYPDTYASVLAYGKKEKTITPMRYRLRPHWAEKEIPRRYNLFNARYDSLLKRKSWAPLIGRRHGIFPFYSFYEWVEGSGGKKQLIRFSPREKELMWAPCLWDYYRGENEKESILSFALITDDPPKEISAAGHDRVPIFLKEDSIQNWLRPENRSVDQILALLKEKEQVFYQHQKV